VVVLDREGHCVVSAVSRVIFGTVVDHEVVREVLTAMKTLSTARKKYVRVHVRLEEGHSSHHAGGDFGMSVFRGLAD
jgi:hypothetical protein